MPYNLGSLFPEEIVSGKRRIQSKIQRDEPGAEINRFWLFFSILVFGLGILIARLFVLTVIEGGRYRKLAQENRTREVKNAAPRGIFYDRNNTALVRNIPFFKLSNQEVYFEELPETVSGEVTEGVAREYIYNNLFAHVLGYTGEVSKEEMDGGEIDLKNNKYSAGDIVGKMGLEKSKDTTLRGQDGKELIEVDALGNKVRTLGRIPPVAGANLNLTIDCNLQRIAAEQLAGKKGAVIAQNPLSGEILLLYSSPSFDPNAFIKGKEVEKILTDPDNPLFNRVISGTYPPGSTFKIITATASLETGAISKDSKIEDTGILQVGQFSFANWYFTQYGKKEGVLDIVGAIKRSNDIFFYKAGEMTGIDAISAWAKKMGVGTILGIDIPGEEPGIMPDPVWVKKVKNQEWYLGNTYHVAIGQGDILTTPLQVNTWTGAIANGGKLCRPHILKTNSAQDTSDGGRQTRSARHESFRMSLQDESLEVEGLRKNCHNLGIKSETVDLIKEGMKETCNPGGTGWPLFKFKIINNKLQIDNINFLDAYEATASGKSWVEIPVACKTGTAEFGDPKGRTHAWFTAFAPVGNPQISVTVLVEAAGEGSSIAAPIAKKILEEWFSR